MTGDPAGGFSTQDTASIGAPAGTGEASLSGVLSRLETANTAEIQMAKMGASQARSAGVREIAERLVAEHTRNRAQLETLAEQKNVDLVARAGGSTRQDTSGVLALRGVEGAAFDSAFVRAQIEAHQANLDAIASRMLPAVRGDAEVTAYLEKTQSAMQKHLADLQRIQRQLGS